MKVIMRQLAADPSGVLKAGQSYDLPDEYANRLVKAGAAIIEEVSTQPIPEIPAARTRQRGKSKIETTDMNPAEEWNGK